jgi:phosphoglycerate dehydrogenase-like enzyme
MIFVNAKLPEAERKRLADALGAYELVWGEPMNNLSPGSADERLRDASVVFGQPHPQRLLEAPQLRFVQLNSAGWARYEGEDLRSALRARDVALATSSSVYADPVAEHGVAMILALARCLPVALEEQRGRRAWSMELVRAHSRRLSNDTIALVGVGAIARAMAHRLRPFGPRIVGYRRQVRGDEGFEIVDASRLPEVLAVADHIVDLLPESTSTRGFFDAVRLASMKRGARFYNLGRGATVDQAALIAALHRGHLDAAFLDVTFPEPPPPEDPVWTTPNLYLTPHSAGGHVDEPTRIVDHFLANLAAVEAGQAPRDRVI